MHVPSILMISTHGDVAADFQHAQKDAGSQTGYVLGLSKALSSLDFKVDILTRGFDYQPGLENVADGVDVLRLKYGGSHFRPKEYLAEHVPELVMEFCKGAPHLDRYELIMSHSWEGGAAGTEIAARMSRPHIHVPHSLGILERKNQAWEPTWESASDRLEHRIKAERAIYHQSQLIITSTKEQTQCVGEADEYNVPNNAVVQLPAGIDQTVFHAFAPFARASKKRTLGWNGPTVLCAGRLDVSKGYDLIIQAFPAVLQRVPNAQLLLLVCGDNMSHKEQTLLLDLQVLAHRLNIASSVCFQRRVDQQRLADYYCSADVFVLPSRNEPFGIAAIEAMACGTPTVLTTRGGLWEEMAWGQDCIYCDPVNREALSQAICSTLTQPSIHNQLSLGGAAKATSRYIWSRIAEDLLTILNQRKLLRMRTKTMLSLP